jgi:hypothetical protein
MTIPGSFRVRRLKNGAPLEPESQTFKTQMLAIEHAETLDIRADENVQVLSGSEVVWTRPATK